MSTLIDFRVAFPYGTSLSALGDEGGILDFYVLESLIHLYEAIYKTKIYLEISN